MLKSVKLLAPLLVVVLALGVFAAGYGVGQHTASARPADDQGFALLHELLVTVRGEYLNPIPESSALFDGAARGLLETLRDPYTRYMGAKAFKDFSQDTQGFFYGIGIFIDIRDGHLIVVAPLEGTPAFKAGLRSGDHIRMINDVLTDGMALQEAVTRIRGPAGTKVKLQINRPDQTFAVEITRGRVELVTVRGPGALDAAVQKQLAAEHIGFIRILTFNEHTAGQVNAALDRVRAEGAKGLLIDLRNNGGGLLDTTIKIANRFVPEGKAIVHVVDRNGKRTTEGAVGGPKVDVPVVMLVNEFSASASEILAGALKESAGATLVGRQTFGKGVIQSIFPLTGGGGAAITTAKYLTPAGHDIHGKGIPPNVQVGDKLEGKAEADVTKSMNEQMRKAIDVLKQRMAQRR